MAPITKAKFLSQAEAIAVDQALFEHFSVDCLMELAGLSVAAAVDDAFPTKGRILCVCGPGNNGGDGLVAARHLKQFGWDPTVVYPKPSKGVLFESLCSQMKEMRIPILETMPEDIAAFDVALDAIFGFSFKPPARPPFDAIVRALTVAVNLPVVSVDIPSGWDVESGPPDQNALMPEVLVSLTAPKLCAAHFKHGRHYLGGRFVPPTISERFGFMQPRFPGTNQVVRLL